jgi:hypothetical protein
MWDRFRHGRLFRDAFFETLVTGHAGTAEAEQLAEHLAPLVPGGRAPEAARFDDFGHWKWGSTQKAWGFLMDLDGFLMDF